METIFKSSYIIKSYSTWAIRSLIEIFLSFRSRSSEFEVRSPGVIQLPQELYFPSDFCERRSMEFPN